MIKLLVVGNGGREHAIAWKLAQSPKAVKVFVATGNAGSSREENIENVNISDINELVTFAKENNIYFTVVGPEAPLSAGIVDAFRANGLRIFGPTQGSAQLESSKDFAKQFMKKHQIPTADYQTFTDAQQAHDYINAKGVPIVIKADGLAAGKGVIVATDLQMAHDAIDDMLLNNKFGGAGARVVIEEFLAGEEASFIVLVDGKNILPLASSQDHKRLLNEDLGPNTGGMGAYSPAPVVTPDLHHKIMRDVIRPTVEGMAKDGYIYTGFLYAGIMVDDQNNPKVLEFNCRMGDPETQPIMMRLKSDLVDLIDHAINQKLDQIEAEWDRRTAIGVVLAAYNYPETPRKGDVIHGLNADFGDDVHVFHAGTALNANNEVVTSGGRVLCVTALGDSVKIAQVNAYQAVNKINFDGMQCRTDIGYRAINR